MFNIGLLINSFIGKINAASNDIPKFSNFCPTYVMS